MTKLSASCAVIPPKKNRKELRDFDRHIYKQRHLVENAFLKIKQWRGIATRYAKSASSFVAAVQIRCLALWLQIS
jgi:transposase